MRWAARIFAPCVSAGYTVCLRYCACASAALNNLNAKHATSAAPQDRFFEFSFDGFTQDFRVSFFLPTQSTVALVGWSESFFDQRTGAGLRAVKNPDGARLLVVFGFLDPSAGLLNRCQKTADVILVLVIGNGAKLLGAGDS